MAVFNSNEDFNDIQNQLQYVRTSLGWKTTPRERDYGCSRRGDGWSNPFYYVYCVRCNMEIEKPFIDEKDEQKLERCPECQKHNALETKAERKQELQERIDDLNREHLTMRRHIQKWKKFRRKYPLKLVKKNSDYDYYEYNAYLEEEYYSSDSDEWYSDDDNDDIKLEYDENTQWVSTGIDIESYVINEWYIPKKVPKLKERAKNIFEKYKVLKAQYDKAISDKNLGNECYKNGEFAQAIVHYTNAMMHRTDFKSAYTNRALMYFKLKQYNQCILDCTMVIEMCNCVYSSDDKQMKSNELFKAYLRRANAFLLLANDSKKYENVLFDAQSDITHALGIKPNDGAAKKVSNQINIELKRNKVRKKLRNIDRNEKGLNDFDFVFNLSIQFLQESTVSDSDGFVFESRDSEELLRRLYVFMTVNKKYCVKFVDNNGLELCLKYLEKKFKILSNFKDKTEKKEKTALLIRPFSLLNICCENTVNLKEFKKKKHLKLTRTIVKYTMFYWNEMKEDLKGQSMKFISVIMSVENIRDNISEKSGKKMMQYFVGFQNKTNPKTQNTNAIRYLFETFSSLFQCKSFRIHLYQQRQPYLYEIFLHSMNRYQTFVQRKDCKEMDSENINYSIAVLLDGLGLIFDSEACLGRTGYGDDDSKLQTQTNAMITHFVRNKNINQYMALLKQYLEYSYDKFKEISTQKNESEIEKNFSQIIRSLNVFVQLSDPSYDKLMNEKLYEFSIDKHVVLLMLFIGKTPENNANKKMRAMLKLAKYKLLTFLDQISDNKRFDTVYGTMEFDANESNKTVSVLPYFWKFVMDVFSAQYRANQITPKLMEEFSMNKSRTIRTVYRWMNRVNESERRSFVMELMIKKYMPSMLEWLGYSDEQIMANTPLVINEVIKYSKKQNKKKKTIKKALNVHTLKVILNLMKIKHRVIQYNAMLLMSNIVDFDGEIGNICHAIGANGLLQAYQKSQSDNNRKQIKM